jgi:HSP20 family protein
MTDLALWRKQEMDKLKKDLDLLFREFRRGFGVPGSMLEFNDPFSVDLSEREKALIVRAEFPGMTAENIEVSVTDEILTLTGKFSEERVTDGESRQLVEKRTRTLSRTVSMPCRIDADGVKASFRDGTLTIELPRCKPQEPRAIKVNSK